MFRSLIPFLALALMPAIAMAAPEVGKPAPDFTGTDYKGQPVKLSDYKGKIVVLEWTNPGCPFVKKHYGSGNMQQLQTSAKEKGVVWLTINSSAAGKQGYMDQAQAQEAFKDAAPLAERYILDPDGTIGRLYDAKTTPHMFVINEEGNVLYMGAIDNKPTPDAADIPGSTNYVQAALDSALKKEPVVVASTQAYGCSVKYN